MKRILFVFATAWDAKQLEACRGAWEGRYRIEFVPPSDVDCPDGFRAAAWLEETARRWRGRADGVTSSSDYPGATLAAALARELGVPGSAPEAILRCSHKWYSRAAQREVVPEATPWFALVDPKRPLANVGALRFPCWVKPVKGSFSVFSRRVDRAEELAAFLDRPSVHEFVDRYLELFHELVREHTGFEKDGRWFLAEELLTGSLATVEGFAAEGDVEIVGIVDSVTHPVTGSFVRFNYPSALPRDVQERMRDIAVRLIRATALSSSMFNIEMMYDPREDRVRVIEVNPRLCGQFADLYAKVDGTSGYEVALAVAAGERPEIRRGGRSQRAASSFPLRVFEHVRVTRSPDERVVRRVEAEHPGALVWNECAAGQELAEFEGTEDGASCRYGVVNVGGLDRADVLARFDEVLGDLDWAFAPLRS
ncbi:MAG: ATP-grasp domain-containing protein [bacterium]